MPADLSRVAGSVGPRRRLGLSQVRPSHVNRGQGGDRSIRTKRRHSGTGLAGHPSELTTQVIRDITSIPTDGDWPWLRRSVPAHSGSLATRCASCRLSGRGVRRHRWGSSGLPRPALRRPGRGRGCWGGCPGVRWGGVSRLVRRVRAGTDLCSCGSVGSVPDALAGYEHSDTPDERSHRLCRKRCRVEGCAAPGGSGG